MALFFTWAIMGLWHGANWTFVIWGLYHAALIAAYRLLGDRAEWLPESLRPILGWSITLPLVMLGWIPFRAQTVEDTFAMLSKLIQPSEYFWLGMRENTYLITALLFAFCMFAYAGHKYGGRILRRSTISTFALETLATGVMASLAYIFLRPISQFIYFQF